MVTPRRNAKDGHTDQRTIRFDPQRRAGCDELKRAINALSNYLEVRERELGLRKRQRRKSDSANFRLAIEALSCNLLIASMVGPDTPLMVPRGHETMWGKNRYASPVYGQHFIDAIDLMARPELGLIHKERGWRVSNVHKKPSTIVATELLANHLPLSAADWSVLWCEVETETIILKPSKDEHGNAPPIDYKKTRKTDYWRRQMYVINGWLAAASITLERKDGPLVRFDKLGQPIDPNRRTLCRHFNNGRWDEGGRLFGGFWMNMAREDRYEFIRISGERIANVDYGQLFPRLAYVRARAEQPTGDLYDISNEGTRAGWKMLMNALLFAQNPLRQWPRGTLKEFPKGTRLRDIVQAVKERHAPIAHLFEEGMGFKLMHLESEMLIAIVQALFKKRITALPLHDSVLVARSQAEAAKAVMKHAFEAYTGQSCAFVSVDYPPDL